jgi:hypothetical protein
MSVPFGRRRARHLVDPTKSGFRINPIFNADLQLGTSKRQRMKVMRDFRSLKDASSIVRYRRRGRVSGVGLRIAKPQSDPHLSAGELASSNGDGRSNQFDTVLHASQSKAPRRAPAGRQSGRGGGGLDCGANDPKWRLAGDTACLPSREKNDGTPRARPADLPSWSHQRRSHPGRRRCRGNGVARAQYGELRRALLDRPRAGDGWWRAPIPPRPRVPRCEYPSNLSTSLP